MEFSGFPYEVSHNTAPGFIPTAVFGDGKIGCQTAQKRVPWGVGSCEDRKVDPRSSRESSIIQVKYSIFGENSTFCRIMHGP